MMDGMEDQESDDYHMCNVCNEEIVGGDLEEDEVLASHEKDLACT